MSDADDTLRAAAERVMRHVDPDDEGFPALVRFFRNAVVREFGAVYEYEDAHACKHEWRQYMAYMTVMPVGLTVDEPTAGLMPDGFFCIHCTERRD